MINCLIIDDDKNICDELKKHFDSLSPDVYLVGIVDSFDKALTYSINKPVNLFFINPLLIDTKEIKLLNELSYSKSRSVFISENQEYALTAFKCNALSLISRPFTETKIENILKKYKRFYNKTGFYDIDDNKTSQKGHFIEDSTSQKKILFRDIVCFNVFNNICRFHLSTGMTKILDVPCKNPDFLLPETCFFKVDNKNIINLYHIKDISVDDMNYYVILTNKLKIMIDENIKNQIIKKIEKFSNRDKFSYSFS